MRLASGKAGFCQGSTVETMAAIVREEASAHGRKVPPPLRWIIDRCLSKEPDSGTSRPATSTGAAQPARPSSPRSTPRRIRSNHRPGKREARLETPLALTACLLMLARPDLSSGPTRSQHRQISIYAVRERCMRAVWSPDGKAVAYSAKVNGTSTVFSPLSQLAGFGASDPRETRHASASDGRATEATSSYLESPTGTESPPCRLYSVATVGGEPEFIMDIDCDACDLSRDGKAFAALVKGKDGYYSVSISDPLGSPLRAYSPAPFASKRLFNIPQLASLPTANEILLFRKRRQRLRRSLAAALSLPGARLHNAFCRTCHPLRNSDFLLDAG